LRAGEGKRLANEQINDQANQEISGRKDENQERPEASIHAAALGVAIDVAKHKQHERQGESQTGDDSKESEAGQESAIAQAFVSREDWAAGLKVAEVDAQADDETEGVENDAGPHNPFGDDAQFLAKRGTLALAAEADQAKAFIE
jgi:hypothetical protein